MKPPKTMLKRVTPVPLQRLVHNLLAKWKSRKFANTRRALRSVGRVSPEWRLRIEDAVACPDNKFIERAANAGQLVDGVLTMHNGIRVGGLSYCGAGVLNMLIENRGVHEPQEERAFGDVLKHVGTGGAMLELGAYWGFYSLWFSETVEDARCYLLEPHPANIRSGQINFKLNNRDATFGQAYAGGEDGTASDGVPCVTVDTYCRRNGIHRLAILHADIQGAEADMLRGAAGMLTARQVDFLFVSTHSNELHYECIELLRSHDYSILATADLDETYSVDGLIVARGPHLASPETLSISNKLKAASTKAA